MKPWLNVARGRGVRRLEPGHHLHGVRAQGAATRARQRQTFDSAEARMDRCLAGTTRARRPGTGSVRAWRLDARWRLTTSREGRRNEWVCYKICKHKGRARDRCKHVWWGSFRGKRVSLAKWTNREISSKAEADIALDELRAAIRDGTFDEKGLDPPADNSPMTFGQVRRGLQATSRARERARAVQHHRLPAETIDRAIRRSTDRRDQDRRHR